uniref:Peptidoglycan recognition protein 6 n=1 Tax=Oryzias sinensis TaxID=183150 RepID=A0A8C8DV71_9TELE
LDKIHLTCSHCMFLIFFWSPALFSCHMKDFIKAVQQVEDENPELEAVEVLRMLRRTAHLNDAFVQHFLPDAGSSGPELDADLSGYLQRAVQHRVLEGAREEGVVLAPDGMTVAVGPLLLGIEAGFLSTIPGRVPGLYQLTLAGNLGVSIRRRSENGEPLGTDGCWDNLTAPHVFTLSDTASTLTAAQVHGGMDGVILGKEVSAKAGESVKLSSLLTDYYLHQLDARGMDGAPRLISRRRRELFKVLVAPPVLIRQVAKSMELREKLEGRVKMEVRQKRRLMAAVKETMKEFVHVFMECPPIIARCTWGAAPYIGTPTLLSLPLTYLFIHHTASPSQPCLTFEQCSADMRSMQRFHQEERGWDDIGYSFVAGSDGNVYEGRGWKWQGAHTGGYNSKGYGVSFIGDYTSTLPSQHAMALVRDQLASCAVAGGRLVSSYILKGHRQMVSTSCPGNTFYKEITTWGHYQVRAVNHKQNLL